METYLLRVHQGQVKHLCEAALEAREQIYVGLATGKQPLVWIGLHNLVDATANISKEFWGDWKTKTIEARRPLRESLGVEDTSPFRNRSLRNHLEHFDERLDAWYHSSKRRNYADFLIGPPNTIVGIERSDIFRHFDPQSGYVYFGDESYNIGELAKAVDSLFAVVAGEAVKPHWDPHRPRSGNEV